MPSSCRFGGARRAPPLQGRARTRPLLPQSAPRISTMPGVGVAREAIAAHCCWRAAALRQALSSMPLHEGTARDSAMAIDGTNQTSVLDHKFIHFCIDLGSRDAGRQPPAAPVLPCDPVMPGAVRANQTAVNAGSTFTSFILIHKSNTQPCTGVTPANLLQTGFFPPACAPSKHGSRERHLPQIIHRVRRCEEARGQARGQARDPRFRSGVNARLPLSGLGGHSAAVGEHAQACGTRRHGPEQVSCAASCLPGIAWPAHGWRRAAGWHAGIAARAGF